MILLAWLFWAAVSFCKVRSARSTSCPEATDHYNRWQHYSMSLKNFQCERTNHSVECNHLSRNLKDAQQHASNVFLYFVYPITHQLNPNIFLPMDSSNSLPVARWSAVAVFLFRNHAMFHAVNPAGGAMDATASDQYLCHPRMRTGNNFSWVSLSMCLSVCVSMYVSVQAIPFEPL